MGEDQYCPLAACVGGIKVLVTIGCVAVGFVVWVSAGLTVLVAVGSEFCVAVGMGVRETAWTNGWL